MIHSWIFVCTADNKNLFGLERNQQELEIITVKELEKMSVWNRQKT